MDKWKLSRKCPCWLESVAFFFLKNARKGEDGSSSKREKYILRCGRKNNDEGAAGIQKDWRVPWERWSPNKWGYRLKTSAVAGVLAGFVRQVVKFKVHPTVKGMSFQQRLSFLEDLSAGWKKWFWAFLRVGRQERGRLAMVKAESWSLGWRGTGRFKRCLKGRAACHSTYIVQLEYLVCFIYI